MEMSICMIIDQRTHGRAGAEVFNGAASWPLAWIAAPAHMACWRHSAAAESRLKQRAASLRAVKLHGAGKSQPRGTQLKCMQAPAVVAQ